jgi:transcriptional regulator with XRE-family HTH domain
MVQLKQLRLREGLSQRKVAERVGVSQPHYQRWETRVGEVPADKVKRLALVLKAKPEQIQTKHMPKQVHLYPLEEDNVPDDQSYYGEVSVHFHGGGKPLVLSISEAAFSKLYRDIQGGDYFVCVHSLMNQLVAIRREAIAELHMMADKHIQPEEVEGAKAHEAAQVEDIYNRVKNVNYQFSTGKQRSLYVEDDDDLYDAAYAIFEDLFDKDDPFIRLPMAGGYHEVAFINLTTVDYISVPHHRFTKGHDEALEKEIAEAEELESKPEPVKRKRGRPPKNGADSA